jgi:hypothetical protein
MFYLSADSSQGAFSQQVVDSSKDTGDPFTDRGWGSRKTFGGLDWVLTRTDRKCGILAKRPNLGVVLTALLFRPARSHQHSAPPANVDMISSQSRHES